MRQWHTWLRNEGWFSLMDSLETLLCSLRDSLHFHQDTHSPWEALDARVRRQIWWPFLKAIALPRELSRSLDRPWLRCLLFLCNILLLRYLEERLPIVPSSGDWDILLKHASFILCPFIVSLKQFKAFCPPCRKYKWWRHLCYIAMVLINS